MPRCSASSRVSPRYKKTEEGFARLSFKPPALATPSASEMRQASKANCPCCPGKLLIDDPGKDVGIDSGPELGMSEHPLAIGARALSKIRPTKRLRPP
jgi:hypothetical protein